ncbi:unnamed protein product [Pseudo-nitzschia multistriata]|uniref:Transmembrane protein n=1 Tax=Pseudo-nitzschia multistriata TaxID=183589 RepID=A0A448ZRZ1_9STRA|nr:unnamed protein product [Pseudo-nitzschia multistriata]
MKPRRRSPFRPLPAACPAPPLLRMTCLLLTLTLLTVLSMAPGALGFGFGFAATGKCGRTSTPFVVPGHPLSLFGRNRTPCAKRPLRGILPLPSRSGDPFREPGEPEEEEEGAAPVPSGGTDPGVPPQDGFDGEGFAKYLLPYAVALVGSVLATAALFRFVLLDY